MVGAQKTLPRWQANGCKACQETSTWRVAGKRQGSQWETWNKARIWAMMVCYYASRKKGMPIHMLHGLTTVTRGSQSWASVGKSLNVRNHGLTAGRKCVPEKTIYFYVIIIIFFFLLCSLQDLSSLTRTEPRATAVKSLSPKHWTAGETSKLFPLNLHSIRELVAGFHFQNHWACEYSVILPRDTGPHASMLCPHLSVWYSKAPTQTRGLLYPSQRLGWKVSQRQQSTG